MKNRFDLATTLIVIYLALLTLCIALYAVIQIYVEDKSTATNLMIWSATLFPSIVLIYTFNSWKHQKKMEELSILAKEIYKDFHSNFSRIHKINGIVWDLLERDEDQIRFVKEYTKEQLNELFKIESEDKLYDFSQIIDDEKLSNDIVDFIERIGGLMMVLMIYKNDLYSKYSILTIENNEDILDRFKSIDKRIKSMSYFID